MRVLFVTHSFPRHDGDGAGEFILRLAVALVATGCDVRVLAPSAPGLERETTIRGVRVSRFRYAPRSWETLAYEGTMAEQVADTMRGKLALVGLIDGTRRAVARITATWRPDVIHAHWWFPCGIGAALARGNAPVIVTMHGSDVRLAAHSVVAPALFRLVARRSARLMAVSSWLAKTAEGFAPGLEVGVAPMPVDTALFTPGAWPRTPTLLAVGRLNEQKGVSDCIQLLAQLPDAVTADIVGDGPDRDRLHTMARTLGVGGRIRWHGRLPQSAVAPLYRGALATVMPSRDEGLGLVAVESLLSETPVVAYRSGGIVDLIVDGETGLLTREGSVDELAAAVMQLLDNPASAERMGAAGRARMLSAFSPATAAATYHAVYQAAVR